MRAACISVLLVLATACAGTSPSLEAVPETPSAATQPATIGPTPTAPTTPPPGASPEPTTPAPTPTPTPRSFGLDLGLSPASTPGIVTAAGIPVAVLADLDSGFLVRSPCGWPVEVTGGTPIGDVDVVLDAGHGGPIDTGAVGPNGLVERDLNLRLSLATEDVLSARGVGVAQTRVADYLLPLQVRAAFADDLGATIMISIHHNAPFIQTTDAPGTEVFVQTGSEASARLGGLLFEEVRGALDQFEIAWSTAPDAGVLRVLLPSGRDAYGMIRNPSTPTALVELGYLANPAEAELFATQEYIDVASVALADAVEAYLDSDRSGAGFEQPARTFTPAFAPGADVCDDPVLE